MHPNLVPVLPDYWPESTKNYDGILDNTGLSDLKFMM